MDAPDKEYAGLAVRVGAFAIDAAIFVPVALAMEWLVYGERYFQLVGSLGPSQFLGFADFLVSVVLPLLWTVGLWMAYGGTPGKRLLGLRVVDARRGDHLGVLPALVRYLLYGPSLVVFGFGFLWVLADSRRRGWHDIVAGSVVIRERRTVEPVRFDK